MKNWKTSLVGILAGIGSLIAQMAQDGKIDIKTVILSAGAALLGLLAKDHDVTGGTREVK
jgi:hypothetical protein